MYENELFTRLTATGKPEHSDLNMEHSVGHVHKHLGKVERPGMATKMEYICQRISKQPTDDHISQDLRSGTTAEKKSQLRRYEWLKDKSPLIHGHHCIHNEIQLWHHTNEPIIGLDKSNKPIYMEPNSLSLPDKETLNPDVLRLFDIGSSRVREYLQHSDFNSPYKVNCYISGQTYKRRQSEEVNCVASFIF